MFRFHAPQQRSSRLTKICRVAASRDGRRCRRPPEQKHFCRFGFTAIPGAILQVSFCLERTKSSVTDGDLAVLKLIGLSVWERRTGNGRNVTFPARQYAVNGERRSFALLRPIGDVSAQERIRDLVLRAYAEYEQETAVAAG